MPAKPKDGLMNGVVEIVRAVWFIKGNREFIKDPNACGTE